MNIRHMILLAWRLICRRITHFFFLQVLVCLSFSLFIFTQLSFINLTDSIRENNSEQYGKQQATVFNVSEDVKQKLLSNSNFTSSGVVQLYGLADVVDTGEVITLGSFDITSITLAHIKLVKGRFPEKHNEIILEENTLSRLNLEINQALTLEAKGKQVQYIVTGVIKDYAATRNIPEKLERGKTELPTGIVMSGSSNHIFDISAEHILLFSEKSDLDQIIYQIDEVSPDLYMNIVNERMYINGEANISNINSFYIVIFAALLIISCILFYYVFNLIYIRLSSSLRFMIQLGAKKLQILEILSLAFFLSSFPAIIMGVICGGVFAKLYINSYSLQFNPLVCATSPEFFLFLFSIIILFLWINTKQISEYFKDLENRQSKGRIPFKMKKNFIRSYVKHHVKTNYKAYIPLIVSLCLITMVVSIVDIYFQELIADNNYNTPSFVISPYTTEAYKEYGAYRIYETVGRGMSIEEYLELSNSNEIKKNSLYIHARVTTEGAALSGLLDSQNHYWESFSTIVTTENNNVLDIDTISGLCNDYRIIVSSEKLVEQINMTYCNNGLSSPVTPNDSILFLPYYQGEKLTDVQFRTLSNDNGNIQNETFQCPIDTQINSLFDIDLGKSHVQIDVPTLVIPFSKLQNYSFVKGIGQIVLFVEDSDDVQKEINQLIKSYMMKYPDSYVFSLFDFNNSEERNVTLIKTASSSLIYVFSLFIFIVYCCLLFLSLKNRQRELILYRILGFSFDDLRYSTFQEACCYVSLSFFVSIIPVIVLYFFAKATIFMSLLVILLLYFLIIIACFVISKVFIIQFSDDKLISLFNE